MKEYGELLDTPAARAFAERVRDVSEVLGEIEPRAPRGPLPMKVVYHDACHLAHAQQRPLAAARAARRDPGARAARESRPSRRSAAARRGSTTSCSRRRPPNSARARRATCSRRERRRSPQATPDAQRSSTCICANSAIRCRSTTPRSSCGDRSGPARSVGRCLARARARRVRRVLDTPRARLGDIKLGRPEHDALDCRRADACERTPVRHASHLRARTRAPRRRRIRRPRRAPTAPAQRRRRPRRARRPPRTACGR